MRRVWLASYPKSGNTWLRILFANVFSESDAPVGINSLVGVGGIASAREPLERLFLIDSGLHSHDEIDLLRPRLYAWQAADDRDGAPPVSLIKVHDAYLPTPGGEPLLAGRRGADGAILIVRDPRDVAPSLANHMGSTIDAAIDFMGDADAAFSGKTSGQSIQLRQRLPTWSGHVASWLDQTDIPVHLMRYEDLKTDPVQSLRSALGFLDCSAAEEKIAASVGFSDFARLRRQEQEQGFVEMPKQRAGFQFFRRGEAGGWRGELTPDQSARVEREHGSMMDRLGYPPGHADQSRQYREIRHAGS